MRKSLQIAAAISLAAALIVPATAASAAGPVTAACQSSNSGSHSFTFDLQCRLQEGPAAHFGYTGTIDGAMGVNSWKGVQRFLAAYYGYGGPIDGAPGTNTYKALQRWAADRGGYRGPIDGDLGYNSWTGVDKALTYDYYSPGARG